MGPRSPYTLKKNVDVIRWALSSLTQNVSKEARILRIRDTLNLDDGGIRALFAGSQDPCGT